MTIALDTFLPYRLDRISDAVSERFQVIYRHQYGMTRPEWKVLAHLGLHDSLTAREIVDLTGLHKTKVSRAVAALEKRRWLARERDKTDRRIEHLALTSYGRESYNALGALLEKRQGDLLQSLSDAEKNTVFEALSVLERVTVARS